MRTLHIIMPMAGEGTRFRDAGWTIPKPLIMLNEKPLFMHAISSIDIPGVCMKYSFIVRQEHIDNNNIDKCVRQYLPDANIFPVNKTTRGAVESCLMAESAIDDNDGIVVMDCDLEFRSRRYNEVIAAELAKQADDADGGCLVSFESDKPKYSYVECDASGHAIRTAEKEVISNHAICGAYFFSTGRMFKSVAHELMDEKNFNKKEYYVSLLYNYLLRNGATVHVASMEEYYSYGTPEEMREAEKIKK